MITWTEQNLSIPSFGFRITSDNSKRLSIDDEN